MALIASLVRLIPSRILERLYGSKFKPALASLYSRLNMKDVIETHRIANGALIEINPHRKGENTIAINAYEPTITKTFSNLLINNGIVFDVGAWIGYYTLLAAKKSKQVIAIEADETNYRRILRNLEINGFDNVTVMNVGVGEQPSSGVVLEGPMSTMHKVSYDGNGRSIEVQTLDNIITNRNIHHIDLMILDIEGFEYFALNGMRNSLSSKIVDKILCEIHPLLLKEYGHSENDVKHLLSKNGYHIEEILRRDSKPYHILAKL